VHESWYLRLVIAEATVRIHMKAIYEVKFAESYEGGDLSDAGQMGPNLEGYDSLQLLADIIVL
jgi:hypothetical protein